MSTQVTFPDGGSAYFGEHQPNPLVTVRFDDGGLAEFRPSAGWHPWYVRLLYWGLDVKGLRVDIDAGVDPDGKIWSLWVHKTDVAGADGGNDIPVKVRETVTAPVPEASTGSTVGSRSGGRPREATSGGGEEMSPPATIPLSNQSAMGLYLFAWTEGGRACSVMWGRGDAAPVFTYRSETAGRDITVPVVNPGRFGWPLPVPAGRRTPTPKAFQGFVQRYAQAMHARLTAEAEPAEVQGTLL